MDHSPASTPSPDADKPRLPVLRRTAGWWLAGLMALAYMLSGLMTPAGEAAPQGLGLLVLSAWLVEAGLLWQLGKRYLNAHWRSLMVVFFLLGMPGVDASQPYIWGGFWGVLAVAAASRHLENFYRPPLQRRWLLLSAIFASACLWANPGLGLLLVAAIGLFSLLHVLGHERELARTLSREPATLNALGDWALWWGRWWLLPIFLVILGAAGLHIATGPSSDGFGAHLIWPLGSNAPEGYFSSFAAELETILTPLAVAEGLPALSRALLRIPVAMHLFLVGILPVIGLVGCAYRLPGRFFDRLLHLEDERMLLFWLCGLAFVIATLWSSTSVHLVSNGALPILLGWVALARYGDLRPRRENRLRSALWVLLALVLAGKAIDALRLF